MIYPGKTEVLERQVAEVSVEPLFGIGRRDPARGDLVEEIAERRKSHRSPRYGGAGGN